jgi:putative transposase
MSYQLSAIGAKENHRKSTKKNDSGEATESFFWKPSKRWKRFDCMVERLRRKRREQTKTFLFTIAQALFKQYDLVSIGDYTPDGAGETTTMRRAMNNQSLIGRFKEVLSWVALKSGKHFHEFCEKGTTRTCHSCSHVIQEGLAPDIRLWNCPSCFADHIRDENAAQNGLQRVLRDLNLNKLVPGSGLASVRKRWAWCAVPSGVVSTLRGQGSGCAAAPRNLNGSMIAPDQNLLVNFA